MSTPTVDIPRPDVVPPEPYTFPGAERRTLPNGLEVVVYDVPGQYVHSVRLSVPLPLSREPREQDGGRTGARQGEVRCVHVASKGWRRRRWRHPCYLGRRTAPRLSDAG